MLQPARLRTAMGIALACHLSSGCRSSTSATDSGDRPPPDWSVSKIRALRDGRANQFLIWQSSEIPSLLAKSPAPTVLHEAIICGRLNDGRHFLAHVFRHQRAPVSDWQLAQIDDAPQISWQAYSDLPSQENLRTFLRQTWWKERGPPILLRGTDPLALARCGRSE